MTVAAIPDSGSDRKDDASHFRRQMVIDVMVNGMHQCQRGDDKLEYPISIQLQIIKCMQTERWGRAKGEGGGVTAMLCFCLYRSPLIYFVVSDCPTVRLSDCPTVRLSCCANLSDSWIQGSLQKKVVGFHIAVRFLIS
jgi:hypothetical protein